MDISEQILGCGWGNKGSAGQTGAKSRGVLLSGNGAAATAARAKAGDPQGPGAKAGDPQGPGLRDF